MQAFNFALDRLTNAWLRCRWMRLVMLAPLGCFCAVEFSYAQEPAAVEDAAAAQESSTDAEPAEKETPQVRLIGATTVVTEVTTGTSLPARVDTGATSCSIHCLAMEIKDAASDPRENIGKPVRFLVKKNDGEDLWVESKIVDHVRIRTSEKEDERYKVRLRLRWEDVEKKVVATLNDRQNMKYPMLLGRNFLRDDFLVNVSLDNQEPTANIAGTDSSVSD
jgi:hypothetical protein